MERRQRFASDDPRRDRGAEALALERSGRNRLPGLDGARRPIVEQAIAEDMVARRRERDRRPERVAARDERADLELEILPRLGTEAQLAVLVAVLAVRPLERRRRSAGSRWRGRCRRSGCA